MKKSIKYLSYAFRFITTGVFIGLIFSLILSYVENTDLFSPSTPAFIKRFSSPLTAVSVSVLLWALMELVFGLGNFIFAIKNGSYLKKTVVNFIINYLGFTHLAILAGWEPFDWITLLIFTGELIHYNLLGLLVSHLLADFKRNQRNKSKNQEKKN